MSLINICYEQIKDNYRHGIFDDFKLIIDINTGFLSQQNYVRLVEKNVNIGVKTNSLKKFRDYNQKHLVFGIPTTKIFCMKRIQRVQIH